MAYVLIPPTVQETPADLEDWYLCRIGIDRGISIIQRMDRSIYQTRFPSQDELIDAYKFWLGGHESPISDEERADLIAAGYGAYIHFFYPPDSYGSLNYGEGNYGG